MHDLRDCGVPRVYAVVKASECYGILMERVKLGSLGLWLGLQPAGHGRRWALHIALQVARVLADMHKKVCCTCCAVRAGAAQLTASHHAAAARALSTRTSRSTTSSSWASMQPRGSLMSCWRTLDEAAALRASFM
jgi:hypothetical protein